MEIRKTTGSGLSEDSSARHMFAVIFSEVQENHN